MAETEYFSQLVANAKQKNVPVKKLKLDIGNVRFIHVDDKKTEKDVEKLILEDSKTYELCEQIAAAGAVLDPIVIDSNYRVIDGNRRVVCLRILNREIKKGKLPEFRKDQFKKVKCRILPENVNKKTLDLFLVTIHYKGRLPWKRFNRAKHISNLRYVHVMSYDEIVRLTGLGRATISRNITVYRHVQNYARRFPDDGDWVRKFTYFDELFKRRDLKEYRTNPSFIEKFSKWVFEKKFRDVRDVRKLHEVFSDPVSKKAFEREGFPGAERALEKERPDLVDKDFKKIRTTIDSLRNMSRDKLDDIISNPAKMKLLIHLETEIRTFLVDIEARKKTSDVTRKKK